MQTQLCTQICAAENTVNPDNLQNPATNTLSSSMKNFITFLGPLMVLLLIIAFKGYEWEIYIITSTVGVLAFLSTGYWRDYTLLRSVIIGSILPLIFIVVFGGIYLDTVNAASTRHTTGADKGLLPVIAILWGWGYGLFVLCREWTEPEH